MLKTTPHPFVKKTLNLVFLIGCIYVLFQVERILFYLFNRNGFADLSFFDLLYYMGSGARFDSTAIVYTNLLFTFLYLVPSPLQSKIWYARLTKIVFVVFNAVALLPGIADIEYYKYTFKRTTFQFFLEFKNENMFGKLFFVLAKDYWYYTLIWLGMIGLLIWMVKKITFVYPFRDRKKIYDYILHIALVLTSITFIIVGARGGWAESTRPITMNDAGQYCKNPQDKDIVLNSTFCIYKTIESSQLSPKDYFKDNAELHHYYHPIHTPNVTSKAFKKKNIVFLVLESFGGEITGFLNPHLQKKYQHYGFTPFLDSLSKKSIVFMNGYANGRKSIDALPSIVASIPTIHEPYIASAYYANTLESLSQCLVKKNYSTSFFHGAPNGSMGFWAFLHDNGFQQYYGKDEFNNDAEYDGIWGIWDEPFLQFMADNLNQQSEPFFSVFFSVSSHSPYKIPQPYQSVFKEGKRPLHKCIRYTDQALQKFFDKIAKTEWYKNTLFVICADHCQSDPMFEEYMSFNGLFRIPILIFDPSQELKPKKENTVFSHIDIMPTVLDYLHYDLPYYSVGKSYFSNEKKYVFTNLYGGNIFYLWDEDHLLCFDETKSIAFYDLKTDTFLHNNIVDKPSAKKEEMEKYIKAFLQGRIQDILNNTLTADKWKK